jgi:hypothetical protein
MSPMLPKSGIDLGGRATAMHWISGDVKTSKNPKMRDAV